MAVYHETPGTVPRSLGLAPLAVNSISADIAPCLATPPANTGDGSSAASPIILPVAINLADGTNGWAALLTAISGKYVALDLSACTMTGTEFDPGMANTVNSNITLTISVMP